VRLLLAAGAPLGKPDGLTHATRGDLDAAGLHALKTHPEWMS
jgi:hypothetical protein